jgi:rRNA maturation endonuclease Nob1
MNNLDWVYRIELNRHGRNTVTEYPIELVKSAGYKCQHCYKIFNKIEEHDCKKR